jgi:hypothetical protein
MSESTTGTKRKIEADVRYSMEERSIIAAVERNKGRALTPSEIKNSLDQARALGEL